MIRNLIDLGINTATITRYSQSHMLREESVLEHTGFVALFCATVGLRHGGLHMLSLMLKAVSHDLEESEIGDIAATTKKMNAEIKEQIEKVSDAAMINIAKSVKCPDLYYIWRNAKDDTPEGRLVAIADAASVLMKIYEETVIYNNRAITSYAVPVGNFFRMKLSSEKDTVFKQILTELLELCEELEHTYLDGDGYENTRTPR